MSELIHTFPRSDMRLRLLATVSALSLLTVAASQARAEDADRPTVWVELGGQLSGLENKQELYSPPFLAIEPDQFGSPLPSMRPKDYSVDWSGAISIQPEDSKWIFSASIRYGRSGNKNHFHQQSNPLPYTKYSYLNAFGNVTTSHPTVKPLAAQFIEAKSSNSESHTLIDFQVGRDLGVGLFGHDSASSLNLGVRIAQFTSRSRTSVYENPDWAFHVNTVNFSYPPFYYAHFQVVHQPYHSYAGQFEAERNFHGVGPALSWKSSTPFAGSAQNGALSLDWGVNASLLFGRQKTRTQHQTSAQYHAGGTGNIPEPPGRSTLYHHPTDAPAYYSTRSRGVTVPNIGGFAGVSFSYPNAKISVGYRADFFFGVIDGGIDTRKSEDRNFYGPFAAISIGLGG